MHRRWHITGSNSKRNQVFPIQNNSKLYQTHQLQQQQLMLRCSSSKPISKIFRMMTSTGSKIQVKKNRKKPNWLRRNPLTTVVHSKKGKMEYSLKREVKLADSILDRRSLCSSKRHQISSGMSVQEIKYGSDSLFVVLFQQQLQIKPCSHQISEFFILLFNLSFSVNPSITQTVRTSFVPKMLSLPTNYTNQSRSQPIISFISDTRCSFLFFIRGKTNVLERNCVTARNLDWLSLACRIPDNW